VGIQNAQSLSRRHGRSARGFTLVEIALLTVILLVAVGGLSGAVISAIRLSRATEERAIADDGARDMAAQLTLTPFRDIFASYNADPNDDPGVPGSAPGEHFDVRGLAPRRDDPDGRVGRILFPAVDVGGGPAQELREDFVEPRWGMPRDLSGDGQPDNLDHAGDYLVLPATVRLDWVGAGGTRSLQVDVLLVP
jgi:hypothetical protein